MRLTFSSDVEYPDESLALAEVVPSIALQSVNQATKPRVTGM
jgi:hypothetical protein